MIFLKMGRVRKGGKQGQNERGRGTGTGTKTETGTRNGRSWLP